MGRTALPLVPFQRQRREPAPGPSFSSRPAFPSASPPGLVLLLRTCCSVRKTHHPAENSPGEHRGGFLPAVYLLPSQQPAAHGTGNLTFLLSAFTEDNSTPTHTNNTKENNNNHESAHYHSLYTVVVKMFIPKNEEK